MRNFMVTLLLYNCFMVTASSEELARLHKWKKHSKFASLYYLAKDYLNNANIYNTSVEFTVPLFSFTFPTVENPNDYTSLIKQNILGQIIFFVIIIVSFMVSIAFPVFLNEIAPKSRMFPNLQHYHSLLSDTMKRTSQDRVSIQQCLLHAGCEGYTNYEEYGLLALPFRFIFL
jgi:ABC-type phosphate transport system permease subunit